MQMEIKDSKLVVMFGFIF